MAQNGRVILSLAGRIDAGNAPHADQALQALWKQGAQRVTVDLCDVSYMSSSGLRTLILAQRRQASVAGSLILCNVPPRVMRVLRIAGLDHVFDIADCLPDPSGISQPLHELLR